MTLDQLKKARINMAKNAKVKRDVLKRIDDVLKEGESASAEALAWAYKQAKGFAPRAH